MYISRILIFNMLILRFHQSVCVSIQLLPVLLCLLHFGVFIDIIVIHHWCMLMNRFLREFYLQLVKCWWDLNSVITFLWLKFDVLESLLVYNYWLMLFASFFIVYVYDVTDVTQRALLEYLSTNVPVCTSMWKQLNLGILLNVFGSTVKGVICKRWWLSTRFL